MVIENKFVADTNEVTPKCGAQVLFGQYLGWCSERDGLGVEKQHAVATSSIVEAVRGQHNGSARLHLMIDDAEYDGLRSHIETIHWLVEQKDIGILSESLCHKYSLSLAAGEVMKLTTRKILDDHALHDVVDGFMVDCSKAPEKAETGIPGQRHGVSHRYGQALVDLG